MLNTVKTIQVKGIMNVKGQDDKNLREDTELCK